MSERALSPVVGSLVLLALTVGLATMVGVAALDAEPTDPGPQVRFTASADAATDRVSVTHRGGDTLSTGDLRVEIAVDGRPLEEQPPIPFFAAEGFASGPTGPFNSATDEPWRAGETAALRLAATNAPRLDPGDRVEIDLYHDGSVIGELETTA